MNQEPDTLPFDVMERIVPHLTKDKSIVALIAEISESNIDSLNYSHFESIIIKRVELHSENYVWI